MTQRGYTIPELRAAMVLDLAACHTDLERTMVRTIGEQEIRALAATKNPRRKCCGGYHFGACT